MRLLLSAIFTLSTAVSGLNSTFAKDQTFAAKTSEEIARIDETPDRHDASGGRASTKVFSPAAIA